MIDAEWLTCIVLRGQSLDSHAERLHAFEDKHRELCKGIVLGGGDSRRHIAGIARVGGCLKLVFKHSVHSRPKHQFGYSEFLLLAQVLVVRGPGDMLGTLTENSDYASAALGRIFGSVASVRPRLSPMRLYLAWDTELMRWRCKAQTRARLDADGL